MLADESTGQSDSTLPIMLPLHLPDGTSIPSPRRCLPTVPVRTRHRAPRLTFSHLQRSLRKGLPTTAGIRCC